MKIGTRACVAYVAGLLLRKIKRADVYDHFQKKYHRIDGTVSVSKID